MTDPNYPQVLFEWHPKQGPVQIKDKLWRVLMPTSKHLIRKFRRARQPFIVVEHKPNAYIINQAPK